MTAVNSDITLSYQSVKGKRFQMTILYVIIQPSDHCSIFSTTSFSNDYLFGVPCQCVHGPYYGLHIH